MKHKNLLTFTIIITLFTALVIFLPYQNHTIIQIFRIVFGSIFILFLPGYLLTLSFFDDSEIDFLERFALSFALSISVVPLLSFYFNLVGVPINELSVFAITLLVVVANLVYITFFKNKKVGLSKL
ncbi:MAG: DUF1616 domain-containing protein [Candidatus Gracilibacteria bacterium]|nr:DUF1616 domain-containing protein [Candidatus Gracilibacteria bacterium]